MSVVGQEKGKLNRELYRIHLQAANEWCSNWYSIKNSIHESINHEIESKYKIMDNKINKLVRDQTNKPDNDGKSYPRVIKQTNITFSNEKLMLLNKGSKIQVE